MCSIRYIIFRFVTIKLGLLLFNGVQFFLHLRLFAANIVKFLFLYSILYGLRQDFRSMLCAGKQNLYSPRDSTH